MEIRPSIPTGRPAGFSLVELLVVISVIAIIASMAIPNIARVTEQAHFAKNERNAQAVASMAAAARSAGATNQWQNVDSLIDDLEATIAVPSGSDVLTFGISPLNSDERAGLYDYLTVDQSVGMVYYKGPTTN